MAENLGDELESGDDLDEPLELRAARIRRAVAGIAGRRANVSLGEIQWVVNQLEKLGTPVDSRKAKHGYLFAVGRRRFMVNTHNMGEKQVKKYSVDDFVDAMADLGW